MGAIGHHVGWVWTSPAAPIRSRFLPEATSGEGSENAELEHVFDRVLRVAKS